MTEIQKRFYRVTFFEVEMPDPISLKAHHEARWMTPAEVCAVEHLPSGTIFNARHLAPLAHETMWERLKADLALVLHGKGSRLFSFGAAKMTSDLMAEIEAEVTREGAEG